MLCWVGDGIDIGCRGGKSGVAGVDFASVFSINSGLIESGSARFTGDGVCIRCRSALTFLQVSTDETVCSIGGVIGHFTAMIGDSAGGGGVATARAVTWGEVVGVVDCLWLCKMGGEGVVGIDGEAFLIGDFLGESD